MLRPMGTETMHATAEVRGTSAMPRARASLDEESSALTPRRVTSIRDTKAVLRSEESKYDAPSTPTPTVIQTMHAMGGVGSTRAMPRLKESTGD